MAILSDAWNWAGNALSDTGDALFGNSNKPGVFGTGQQKFNPYTIDPNAAKTANGAQLAADAQQRLATVDARKAPTMKSAQIGDMQTIGSQTLGAAGQSTAANAGQAAQMQGATIARGEDQQARAMQSNLNQQLMDQSQGKGPSLASMQLKEATDRNNKAAMGLAAATGNGNVALAQRNAMLAQGENNQAAARDAAMARVAEQNAARAQLGQNLGTTRAQDIGVNTTQAQLAQDAGRENMGATNNFALQNAGFAQQTNLANTAAGNDFRLQQAQLDYQRMAQNAQMQNNRTMSQAELNQQAAMQNQQATLANRAQQDAMSQYYFGSQMGLDQADRAAAMQLEGMRAQQSMGQMGLERGAYEDAARRQSNAMGGIINGASGLLGAVSDEKQKTNITPLSSGQAYDLLPTEGKGSVPKAAGKDPMQAAMSQIGGKGSGGSMSPTAMGGAALGGAVDGISGLLSRSPLANILNMGSSPGADPIGSPTGDMKLNRDASLDVNGSIKQINQSTVTNPTNHPGASPMMGQGGFGIGPFRLSDERQKKEIERLSPSEKAISSDLSKLTPYEYEYKNPDMLGAGHGKHVSPMAQDLEGTKLFSGAVSEDENGVKRVDYAKAFGGMLAGMGLMQKEINNLKKGKG